MKPNRKIRALLAVTRVLTKLRLAPDNARLLRTPPEKRLAMGPTSWMVGEVEKVATEDHLVPTRDGAQIRVRVYRPELQSTTVLYIHGGGFVVGGIASCDHLCHRLAREGGVAVVSVEYRLAPEHAFPGPLDDCEDAYEWMLASGRASTRVIVGGDSAGGNLSSALALRLRDKGIAVAGQLLIYPAVDMTASRPGLVNYRGPGMTPDDCRLLAAAYLAGADPKNPEASPIHASSHAGLPPALVITVEHDALRDEGIAYAAALRDAGVPVRHIDVPGHVHGSLSLPALYEGIDELHAAMAGFVADPAGFGGDEGPVKKGVRPVLAAGNSNSFLPRWLTRPERSGPSRGGPMTIDDVPRTDASLEPAPRHAVHELNNLLGAAQNLAALAAMRLEGHPAAEQVGLVQQAVAASLDEVATLSAAIRREQRS